MKLHNASEKGNEYLNYQEDFVEPRKVPFNYCYRWIKCSIAISGKHYSLFLGCGLLYFFTTTAIGFIPYFGAIASLFMVYLYSLGGMRMVHQIRSGGTAVFDDYLKFSFDQVVFQKMTPFLLIIFVMAIAQTGSTVMKVTWLMLGLSSINYFVVSMSALGSYMMLQDNSLTWQDALGKVLRGFGMNFFTWFAGGVVAGLFALACAMLCFVPFLLYFLPMTIPLGYLLFASIYQGLDIDKTIAEWSSKPSPQQTSTTI